MSKVHIENNGALTHQIGVILAFEVQITPLY